MLTDGPRIRKLWTHHIGIHVRHIAAGIDILLVVQRIDAETLGVALHLVPNFDASSQEHLWEKKAVQAQQRRFKNVSKCKVLSAAIQKLYFLEHYKFRYPRHSKARQK